MSEEQKPQQEIKPPMGDRDTKEMYVDGISQVHLVNGAIKLDLLTINPNGTNTPEAFVNTRVIMTLQQFIASVDVQNRMLEQLVKQGVISKN